MNDRQHQPYLRVFEALKQQIDQGNLQAGDQLQSTRALAAEYEVAQMTVRRALTELQKLGLASPTHGVGWFVTTPPPAEPELDERVSALEKEVRALRERLDEHGFTMSQEQ